MRAGTGLGLRGFLCALILVAQGSSAIADRGSWWDRRDRARGPLAISRIEIGHTQFHSTLNIVFDSRVTPATFGRDDFVAIEISGGKRPRTDYIIFYGARQGRLFTFIYDPQQRESASGGYWHRRPSPRELKVVNAEIGLPMDAPGYRFRVSTFSEGGGCTSGCWDAVPSRGWLLHDWTRPTVRAFELAEWSIPSGTRAFSSVKWAVYDRGLSGLRRRSLMMRETDSGEWTRVRSSSTAGTSLDDIGVTPGTRTRFRVTALDGVANLTRSHTLRTRVPLDDTSTEHQATYFGVWSQQESESAYLATLHVSQTPLATFSFAAEAKMYCVVYRVGDEWGQATFTVGDDSQRVDQTFQSTISTVVPSCIGFDSAEPRTATLKVDEGVVNVDGYYVE